MTDQLGLWSHQAFFNGVQGLIYWKYRPFIRGAQLAGRGLTNYEAEPGHLAEQATRAAAFSTRHADLLARCSPDHAGAAILHDHDAQDLYASIQSWDPGFYVEAHRGIFRGFWEHGISPRYVTPRDLEEGVPRDVRVLAIPCDVCLGEATARALVGFVASGGVLFTEGRFGLSSPDGRLHARVPGHGLRDELGVGEVHFTSDASDRVKLSARGDELVINDYLQSLELGPGARPLLSSEQGRAVLVESRVGEGLYVHAPFLLGRAIYRDTPGALLAFAKAFERMRSALTPALTVLYKPKLVDVSVLVDEHRTPKLCGVCNYGSEMSRIEFRAGALPRSVEGHAETSMRPSADGFILEVPAREAVALIL